MSQTTVFSSTLAAPSSGRAVKCVLAILAVGSLAFAIAGLGTMATYQTNKDWLEQAAPGEMPIMIDDFGNPIGHYTPNR